MKGESVGWKGDERDVEARYRQTTANREQETGGARKERHTTRKEQRDKGRRDRMWREGRKEQLQKTEGRVGVIGRRLKMTHKC